MTDLDQFIFVVQEAQHRQNHFTLSTKKIKGENKTLEKVMQNYFNFQINVYYLLQLYKK